MRPQPKCQTKTWRRVSASSTHARCGGAGDERLIEPARTPAKLRGAKPPREPPGARLIAAGVGPEVRVGLCVERRRVVVGLLGILKAEGLRAANPEYPLARLQHIVRDSMAATLMVSAQTAPVMANLVAASKRADENSEGGLQTSSICYRPPIHKPCTNAGRYKQSQAVCHRCKPPM